MFMRFASLQIRPEAVEAYTSFFDFHIGPSMSKVPGCLFARLIQDSKTESGLLSFTVWNSPEAAHAFEQSDLAAELNEAQSPFAEDATEWKIQLNEDMQLEYKPVQEPPDVKGMNVVAGTTNASPAEQIGDFTYVRFLSGKLRPDVIEEAERIYNEVITPRLLQVNGCRGAYLISPDGSMDFLSVTVWESKQHADEYERSDVFRELNELAQPYLSTLWQWKMSLDPELRSDTLTSEDESVKGYRIITGQKT